ncbi:MAG: NrsF family protein [Stellaceae bacterium]
MTDDDTMALIETLAAKAQPVRRLRPPALRAALWLGAVGVLIALAIVLFSDLTLSMQRFQNARLDWEMAGMLLTGILAVVAAFHLSLPDRSVAWALLPLPPLALWLSSMGYNCYRDWFIDGWALGSSWDCLKIIVGVSVPLCASLLYLLHRAAPLAPMRVAAMGGLGVASIAAFALQFFHPVDVTSLDLGTQAITVGLVVLATSVYERVTLGRTAR